MHRNWWHLVKTDFFHFQISSPWHFKCKNRALSSGAANLISRLPELAKKSIV
jgi:hypothetical protein